MGGGQWLALHPGDPVWIALAFTAGFVARMLGLPPLVGFLAAGFGLNALGAQPGPFLAEIADLGITLLLFTIGLHLSLRMFTRPEVFGVALIHLGGATLVGAGAVLALGAFGLAGFSGLGPAGAAVIGFALAFSSTVFTVKVLEERGARRTRHGRVAMGVLIIQDLAAVVFLAVTGGGWPSVWALGLVPLAVLRRPLRAVMGACGHGELLLLFGVLAAMGGAAIFEAVGLKGDLGALAVGMLLAGGAKSGELAEALAGFKDLFLIGFFLSIGLTAPPTWGALGGGLLLALVIPVKVAGFFGLFTRFGLRARTAWQASLDLATFSEFGLIAIAAAIQAGIADPAVLTTAAIAVAVSMTLGAPVAERGDQLFTRWRPALKRYERATRLPGDEDLHLRPVRVIVFGLGRIGSAAYGAVQADFPDQALGVDVSPRVVAAQQAQGRYAVLGDATDPEFWSRTHNLIHQLDWVVLTMASHEANLAAVGNLTDRGFSGRIAATSRYPDQAGELREMGVDVVFDMYAEAGAGFASDLHKRFTE